MDRGRAGAWVLAALAPAAFLALDPGGWYPFGDATWLAVSVLVPLGAALVWRDRPVRVERPLAVALAALLGLLGLAAMVGDDPLYAWIGTPERRLGVLTWVLCAVALLAGRSLDPERDGPRVAVGLVLAALGVGTVATAEALGWRAGPIGLGGDRLTGTFGSAAYLGSAAALLLPIAVGVGLDHRFGRAVRAAAAVGAVLVGVALAGAGTRSAWVGLAAAVAVGGWCRRGALSGHGRSALVAGLVAVAALGVVAVVTPVGERLTSAFDADAPGGRGRVDEWRVAARVVARHPVLGVGPEGYRTAFAEGADAAYERAHGRDPLPDRAHSVVLDLALAGGVGALAAWLAVLGLVGCSLLRALRAGRPWVAGAAAGLLAHWVGQLLLFPAVELEPVAWLLAGVVVAATAPVSSRRVLGVDPGDQATVGATRARVVPSWATAGLLLVALLAAVTGTLGLVADRRAERAALALARGDGATAAREAEAAADLRPDVLRYRLLEARARVADGQGTVAGLASVDEALDLSPGDPIAQRERARLLVDRARATRVPVHAEQARRYLDGLLDDDPVNAALWRLAGDAAQVDGDATATERAWRRAADLAPDDPDPWTDLAQLYLATDRPDDARRAVANALDRDPDDARARQVGARLPGP